MVDNKNKTNEALKSTVSGTLNCSFKDCDQMIWAFLPDEKAWFDRLNAEQQGRFINDKQDQHNKTCLSFQRSLPKS